MASAASNSTSIVTTMSSATPSSTAAASTTSAPTSSSVDTSSILSSISSAVSSSLLSEPTSTIASTSNTLPVSTSTISESSIPATTAVVTSIVTRTPTAAGDTDTAPITAVVTVTRSATNVAVATPVTTPAGSSATSSSPALNTGGSGSGSGSGGGLSTAGTTAVAVVVPVVAVALLVLAGILLWRKRKQKKASEEQRRKEIEDYGFNPNNDPTLPAVASDSGAEMSEDNSGYRGWGAAPGSNRKMSTTLSGGHTQGQLSDAGSNPYGGSQPGAGSVSPTPGQSDGHSDDPLVHQRRETMNSEIGSLGGIGSAPVAGTAAAGVGVKRGPSNASSTYSAGNQSDVSDGPPAGSTGMSQSYEAYNPNSFGYSQHGPYGDGTYGGSAQDGNGMPIVRDVSARRNTRIQQPGNYQQGNSGIAQNF